jgi:hypothetical protein
MQVQKAVPLFLLLVTATILPSQPAPSSAANQPAIYVVVFRTPAHVRSSKPEVFHGFATDLSAFLREKNVPIKVDPERGTIESESPMSTESMLNIARQVGATSLLFVAVDRPVTKWLKVIVKSYDLEGKLLWSEEASDGGSMTGKGGYKKTLERIEEDLVKRLGTPGLPINAVPGSASSASVQGSGL